MASKIIKYVSQKQLLKSGTSDFIANIENTWFTIKIKEFISKSKEKKQKSLYIG